MAPTQQVNIITLRDFGCFQKPEIRSLCSAALSIPLRCSVASKSSWSLASLAPRMSNSTSRAPCRSGWRLYVARTSLSWSLGSRWSRGLSTLSPSVPLEKVWDWRKLIEKLATNIPSSLFLKSALKRFLGAVLLVYTDNIIRKGGSSKDG